MTNIIKAKRNRNTPISLRNALTVLAVTAAATYSGVALINPDYSVGEKTTPIVQTYQNPQELIEQAIKELTLAEEKTKYTYGLDNSQWDEIADHTVYALELLTKAYEKDTNSGALEIAEKVRLDPAIQQGRDVITPYGIIKTERVYKELGEIRDYSVCEVTIIFNGKTKKLDTLNNNFTLEDLIN